ncbi:Uncharacterised protein [Streptococcus suis]|nr:Uncharacterised protein [Streptococcus suis]VTT13083.1 Uncharacterised protein [Streptococcus suis]
MVKHVAMLIVIDSKLGTFPRLLFKKEFEYENI